MTPRGPTFVSLLLFHASGPLHDQVQSDLVRSQYARAIIRSAAILAGVVSACALLWCVWSTSTALVFQYQTLFWLALISAVPCSVFFASLRAWPLRPRATAWLAFVYSAAAVEFCTLPLFHLCFADRFDRDDAVAAGIGLLALAFAAALWVILRNAVRRQRRARDGLCIACGYDLRASLDRCPECGKPTFESAPFPSHVQNP